MDRTRRTPSSSSARSSLLWPSFACCFRVVGPRRRLAPIASAAIVFALWRRRGGSFERRSKDAADRHALGAILAAMNAVFYLAIEKMPLASVACIELWRRSRCADRRRTARNLNARAFPSSESMR